MCFHHPTEEPPLEYCTLLDYINLWQRKPFILSQKRSSIAGNGIFTEQFIPKNSIILTSEDKIKVSETIISICGMFNDADFIYPANFESKTLTRTIVNYRQSNKNNIRFVRGVGERNDFFLVKANRDIYPGEELTRKYGIKKWSWWLTCDICNINMFNFGKFNYNQAEQREKLRILMEVWSDFGYNLDIKIYNNDVSSPKIFGSI